MTKNYGFFGFDVRFLFLDIIHFAEIMFWKLIRTLEKTGFANEICIL